MDKTIVVAIEGSKKHPLYKKIIKHTVKFKAHDEKNECNVGDKVLIMETRPISRQKLAAGRDHRTRQVSRYKEDTNDSAAILMKVAG